MEEISSKEMELDPYLILDISYFASEKDIVQAFQTKLKSTDDPELCIKAYGMIRDVRGRECFKWEDFRSFLVNPLQDVHQDESLPVDIADLIKELAFLSPWELGEDNLCQKN